MGYSLFTNKRKYMKKLILATLMIAFVFLYSCNNSGNSNSSSEPHPFAGAFTTPEGFQFELRADSTTYITFSDSVTYEGTWKIRKDDKDSSEFANIEFAGIQEFYYLKDGKLYRSEREMRHDAFGTKVTYQN